MIPNLRHRFNQAFTRQDESSCWLFMRSAAARGLNSALQNRHPSVFPAVSRNEFLEGSWREQLAAAGVALPAATGHGSP